MDFYRQDPDDPDAPVKLDGYNHIRAGDPVAYMPPSLPLPEAEHTVTAFYYFGPAGDRETWTTAILDGGTYEVNADHLRPALPPGAAWHDCAERYWAGRDGRGARAYQTDFGYRWTLHPGRDWPRWRVSWVNTTGEIIAVRMTPDPAPVIVYGTCTPGDSPGAHALLADWADHDEPGGLEWLAEVTAELRAPVRS